MENEDFLKTIGTPLGATKDNRAIAEPSPHQDFLKSIGTPLGAAKEAPAPPELPLKEESPYLETTPHVARYPGFQHVEATQDAPEHYEGSRGEWVLPEDISKAYNQTIGSEVERQHASEYSGTGPIREFIQGATIGHEPQLEALGAKALGVVGLAPDRPYREEVAIARGLLEKFRKEHPTGSFAAGVAGGVGGMVALPEILPTKAAAALEYANPLRYMPAVQRWARIAPQIGEKSFDAAKAAEQYWARQAAVRGAASGAPYGAVYAEGESSAPIGSGEWTGDIVRGAETGAASGAILGPALTGAGRGLRNSYNYLLNRPAHIAEKTGEAFEASGVASQDVINQVVPPPTKALADANITQKQLLTALERRAAGDTVKDIAHDLDPKLEPQVLTIYFTKNKDILETPQNMLSAVRSAAGENYKLAMTPLERNARRDVVLQGPSRPGAIDPEQALQGPLVDQASRIAGKLERVGGGEFRQTLKKAKHTMDVDAKQIYQDVDSEAIKRQFARDTSLNYHNHYNQEIAGRQQALEEAVAARNAYEANARASQMSRMGRSPDELAAMDARAAAQRQHLADNVETARINLDNTRNLAETERPRIPAPPEPQFDIRNTLEKTRKLVDDTFGSDTESFKKFHGVVDQFFEKERAGGGNPLAPGSARPNYNAPITEVKDFQKARGMLNNAISTERNSQNRDNHLIKLLSEFRDNLNAEVHPKNPNLEMADKLWHQGASATEILKEAEGAALGLGTKATEQLDYFKKLAPAQKEIFKIGFTNAIKNNILNKEEGSKTIVALSAKQGARQIFEDILGKTKSKDLLAFLDRERNLFLSGAKALSGSRTTPLAEDLRKYEELAHGASAAATGAIHSAIAHGRNLLGLLVRSQGAAGRNAFNMDSAPGAAARNAFAVHRATQNALDQKRMIDALAQRAALVGQGEIRSILPQGGQ